MFGSKRKKAEDEKKANLQKKAELDKKEQARLLKREDRIQSVMKETGWDHDYVEAQMQATLDRYGILFGTYRFCELWKYPMEEHPKIAAERKLKQKRKEAAIQAVMRQSGWDYDTAKSKIAEARKRLGITSWIYAFHGYWEMTPEEQEADRDARLELSEITKENQEKQYEETIRMAMDAKGWTREEAVADIEDAIKRTGCEVNEYQEYEFWNMDHKKQESLYLMCHVRKIRRCLNLDPDYLDIFNKKDKINTVFSEYIGRKWCVNTRVSYEEFCEIFKGCNRIFYKPVISYGGHGAQAYDLTEDNMKEVYDDLQTKGNGMVEEYVVQHPKMMAMSPTAVNTMRLVTMSSDEPLDEEGNTFKIAFVMLKMGGKTGCVDNLRGGGVGAAVDEKTGKLCTRAVSDAGKEIYDKHPVTGTPIVGFEIPYYKEAVAMAKEILEKHHIRGIIGWDIAIGKNGPLVIEINGLPGPTLLVLPYLATEGRGMLDYMRDKVKYFCEI